MSTSQVATVVGALVLTGLMAWYFFGPRKSRRAELADGVQVITVTVKGGYSLSKRFGWLEGSKEHTSGFPCRT